MASTTGWSNSTTPCAVGNNPHSNNATGFTIYNAGNYGSEYPNPYGGASFWSTTWYNGDGVGYHSLGVYSTDLNWYFVESIERWNNGSDYYKVTYDYSYEGQYPVSYRKSYYEVWEGGNYTGYSGMTEYEYVK
ncbi:MAG: hypothetical protein IKO62_00080 [Bacteroidales bacterium]|nr:hypothetical protein [Bacteroidales bacterium]